MNAMNTKFQFALLDLPTELVALVFEQLDDHEDLKNLCLACRKTQELAEPVLYRGALMRSGYAIDKYVTALQQTARRANAVQHLELALDPYFAQTWTAVSRLLGEVKNLRRLFFESPQCNAGRFEDEDEWEDMAVGLLGPFAGEGVSDRPLCKLEELTIHMNGADSPYWDLDTRGISLLMLPSLKYLRLSCVNIMDDTADTVDGLQDHRFTPLRTLELEECNITHKGLHSILSLPKSLETLQLGENCHNVQHFAEAVHSDANHLFQRNAEATVQALSQHSTTLKKLSVVTTDKYFQWSQYRQSQVAESSPLYGGFADFHALESVSLTGDCKAFEQAVMSSRSPPNLRDITFKSDKVFRAKGPFPEAPTVINAIPFLGAPSCSLPKTLQTLTLVYLNSSTPAGELLSDASGKKFVKAAAKTLKEHGVSLILKCSESTSYFPPYLWGEPVPEEHLISDGEFD